MLRAEVRRKKGKGQNYYWRVMECSHTGKQPEDEDGGIGDDFDYCQYEEEYYANSARERKSARGAISDSDRSDSALSISSPRDPPPPLVQKRNQTWDGEFVRTFHPSAIRRAELLDIGASQFRLRGEQFVLSDARLVTHLIDFIDLPRKNKLVPRVCTDTVDPALFSVSGCALDVDDRYVFPSTSFRTQFQKSYLRTLGETILPYHRHLKKICDFVERIQVAGNVMTPALIKAICVWAVDFLRDHSAMLDQLRCKRIRDTGLALSHIREFCQRTELVHKVIEQHISRLTWSWENVETMWNTLFLLTSFESLLFASQRQLVLGLQTKCIDLLLRTMDVVYGAGIVPPDVADHFILYNDKKGESDLLLCRDLHTANSPLWSKELLEICLSGAQSRSRLGAKEYVTNDFSKQLDEILSSEGYLRSGQRLISFDLFASAFNKTALTLTTKLDQKLIRELHANDQLAKLWNDLEQVSSGSVANQYAAMIFTPDSTANDFYDAFWLAVREGVSEENVSRFTWSHAKNEFGCKIEKPLSYFIGDEHIRAMNLCAHFIHVSYRTLEVLMTISTDNALIERLTASHSNTPSECSSTGLETDHMMNSFGLRKRLKYLVFVLKQLVSHFREFFIYKVERAGFRKRVHEAMELYTAMADELRLRSVSKALSQKYLDECEDKLNKSIRMILLLSKQYGHDQDTIFHALAAKIGYRPNSD